MVLVPLPIPDQKQIADSKLITGDSKTADSTSPPSKLGSSMGFCQSSTIPADAYSGEPVVTGPRNWADIWARHLRYHPRETVQELDALLCPKDPTILAVPGGAGTFATVTGRGGGTLFDVLFQAVRNNPTAERQLVEDRLREMVQGPGFRTVQMLNDDAAALATVVSEGGWKLKLVVETIRKEEALVVRLVEEQLRRCVETLSRAATTTAQISPAGAINEVKTLVSWLQRGTLPTFLEGKLSFEELRREVIEILGKFARQKGPRADSAAEALDQIEGKR